MIDRNIEISLLRIAATVMALLGWAAIIVNFMEPAKGWGFVGLALIATWGVMRVRGFFCELDAREANAFTLGRDSSCRKVRSLT